MNDFYKKIDEKAHKLLLRSEALAIPISLEKITNFLKLVIRKKPIEDEFSGFLAVEEKTIVVNLRHAPVRRRFTIAHEIGHYELHRKKNLSSPVFIDRTYFRKKIDIGSVAEHQMEMEANAFAAGLLMPHKLLDEYLDEHADIDVGKTVDIKLLADEFEVSRRAMQFRLRNLGFLVETSF